jgi:dipeptidyl aminopeptidase/acylaminoacyl peptidase
MDEQRLERALRAGPPFATAYVARPLRLDEKVIMSRPLTLRRTAILLAVLALLLAATIVGALLGRVLSSPMAAIAIRDPGGERSYTISVVYSDGREAMIFPQETRAPVWMDDFAWSVDGDLFAFTASTRKTAGTDDTGLYVMRSDGSDLRQVIKSVSIGDCPWALAASMRWAPDRRTLAACTRQSAPGGFSTQLLAIDVVSGTSTILAAGESGAYEWFGPFQWSPNGEWLAYRRQRSGNALWIVRRDGSESRQLAVPADPPPDGGAQPEVSAFAWSPDSNAIAFGDRQAEKAVIEIVRLDGRRSTITLASLEPDVTNPAVLAWDRPDEIVYLAGGGRSVATTSTDGESGELLLDWNRAESPPWIAADGRIDLSRAPWLASDGRTLQWWEPGEASTCLIAAEGGGVRTQSCTQCAHYRLLAFGERR